jgi:ABC-type phosphate/phosphonate transport system substrate-binding protein
MKETRRAAVAALVLLAAANRLARAEAPLRFGLAPNLSPAALPAELRAPREHPERTLAAPVETYAARDFRALANAVQANEYDLALLHAHLARLSVTDWGWAPLARTVVSTARCWCATTAR